MIAEALIKRQEGFRHFVYKCPAGRYTIGYGRNIDVAGGKGISEEEAKMLLRNDIHSIQEKMLDMFFFYPMLDYTRQTVLISMAYNLGFNGLVKFRRMLKAIAQNDFAKAAEEMLDSKWAEQVPNRVLELSKMMQTGDR